MAYEATTVELPCSKGNIIRFQVSDGTGIEKGTPMVISGAATASTGRFAKAATAAGTAESFVGIAAEEKVANDGQLYIGVYTSGIFDMYSGATMSGNMLVKLSGLFLKKFVNATDSEDGYLVGRTLEPASGQEQINVAIGMY